SLIKEFSKTVSSKSVHKELSHTRKRSDESYHEYMYRMMEIASHADIELEAKIQYIIEGIPDEPLSKTILYGARSINDLRKRLTQYEAMKNIQKSSQKNQSTKPGKDVRREGSRVQDGKSTDVKRCHNCGEKNHRAAECPSKSKGTKCFKSLIDPSSDLHLIKAEEYIKIGPPPLTGPAISCKSLSKDRISTLGSFSINVEVDGSSYYLTIHIISDIYMNHSLLLGSDLLSYAKIELTKGNAVITKHIDEVTDSSETHIPEIFSINVEEIRCKVDSQRQIEIDNIEDSLVKHEIKDLIENYKPQKIKETKVKMNIVLKDEIPVYQRPRRLAPAERVQVSKQIDDWLRDGIIRPSISEYASPITLVRCDGDLLLVIPKSMQVDIIKQTHERGHFGVRKTEQLLKREFWFSEMRKKIDKVIKNSEEVINRLSKQAVIFGNPCQIVSDRGTAFTSKSFKKYCADEKIEHILIATGVPRGNGQVERINRIVIPVLTKLSAPHPETWYKFVDRVQQYINSSMSRSTGLSPFELLIGKNMRLKDDLELKQIIEDETILWLQEKRETLREQAKIAIEKVQKKNQRVYNRKRKRPNTYSIGDLVAIKRTQITPGSKLYPKYLGPYQIIHVLRGDRYVVSKVGEHEGPRSTTTSSDNIKRWLVNECDSNIDTSGEDTDNEDGHQGPMPLQNGRDVGPTENV
ncbi:TF26 protein, partial [Pseudoatta argentina]